jgi:hypothetical protein
MHSRKGRTRAVSSWRYGHPCSGAFISATTQLSPNTTVPNQTGQAVSGVDRRFKLRQSNTKDNTLKHVRGHGKRARRQVSPCCRLTGPLTTACLVFYMQEKNARAWSTRCLSYDRNWLRPSCSKNSSLVILPVFLRYRRVSIHWRRAQLSRVPSPFLDSLSTHSTK